MHGLNEKLFLQISFLFFLLALLVPVTLILPFKTTYATLKLHKPDLNFEILILIFLLTEN